MAASMAVASLVLAGTLTTMPAMALTDTAVEDTSIGDVPVLKLADQQSTSSDGASGAMPDNPDAELPQQVSETIPDDATVVSEELAVTSEGEVKDLETGQTVTDETIVGTQDAPADPLAKTDGKSFIPVDASDVKAAVAANGGDANAPAATAEGDNAAVSGASGAISGKTNQTARVYAASLGNNQYGAHWGTYNGSAAFFEADGTLFVQQAKGVIDVSEWQGTIDWSKVKAAGVQGAIIRLSFGYGGRLDAQAKRNVNECKRLGIPFGMYIYSYAESASDGTEEGKDVVAKLKQIGVSPSDLSYPMFYDLENWTGTWVGHKAPTDPKAWNGAVNNWYRQLNTAGYENLGVYSYTNYLNTALNTTNIRSKARWVASYGEKTNFPFSTNDRGWQYTSQGKINGIKGSVDLNAFGVKTVTTHKPAAPERPAITVYRVYNRNSGLHHYTMNRNEARMLVSLGWNDEGASFKVGTSGIPVYREYNPNDGNHNWTMNSNEHKHLVSLGWHDEGIAWYVSSSDTVNVYRLYNPNSGEHVYTTSYGEYKAVGKAGWKQEGVAWKSR
ncbi:glycoside hydrolase family 25 protein [Bifidobacterium sp. SO1]|uniref:glycoside hydrolase family 25 protein n=1 Tax=Bifidobacterium sp. SO1 TaxID=2809029 RepID=UPI0032049EEE